MKNVTGIGGVFFRAKDPAALSKWYQDALGIDGMEKGWSQESGPTVFGLSSRIPTILARRIGNGCSISGCGIWTG